MTEQDDQSAVTPPNRPPSRPPNPPRATPDSWSATFQQTHGREPTMSEYQQALANGEILSNETGNGEAAKERDPSVQQMSDGAKQLASGVKGFYDAKVAPGAKEFFSDKVAPAAKNLASSARNMSGENNAAPTGALQVWIQRAPLILPIAAFVGIIALFLPIATIFNYSVNFFSELAGGEGVVLLILMLLVIAASIAALVTRAKWAQITAGVIGLIAGFFAAFDGFGNMISISNAGFSIGFGLVVLAIVGVALLIAAVLTLMGLRKRNVPNSGPTP